MDLKRILYLGYYWWKQDQKQFNLYFQFVLNTTDKSRLGLWIDVIKSSLRYNISLTEYFYLKFYERSADDRATWAGTGFMYETQRILNPPSTRSKLNDKREFSREYKEFLLHKVYDLDALRKNENDLELVYREKQLVFKTHDGKCGRGTFFYNSKKHSLERLKELIRSQDYDLVETFIVQHDDLNALSPSGVNTVRIITQLDDKGNVHILGCRLRISVNNAVDNLAAGNMVACVDESTGKVNSKAVYSDITRSSESVHPITKTKILGFTVPFWKECMALAKAAALKHPENKSIGWDIVVTNEGVGLLEGNHDWCKLVWQLPADKGLKSQLAHYRELFTV